MINKSNLLILGYTCPYPPSDGGKISLFATIDYLRKYINITLVLNTNTPKDAENNQKLRALWKEVDIKEVINFKSVKEVAIPEKITFTKRILSYLERKLTKPPTKKANTNPTNSARPASYLFPFSLKSENYINTIESILNEKKIDFIQIEYTPYLNLINYISTKNIISIYVEIESRNKVIKDYFDNKDLKFSDAYKNYVLENIIYFEQQLMSRFDAIFALNELDQEELSNALLSTKVYNCPFPIIDNTINDFVNDDIDFMPEKLVFLGSSNHYPNIDALIWFVEDILPKLSSEIKLYVTGNWENDLKIRLASEQVIFTGFLDSIHALLLNSILIVPIRLGGGGIRAKILEAMAFGIPIVSTRIAAPGKTLYKNGENILFGDSASEFADQITKLLNNNALCIDLIKNANKMIKENFTQKVCGDIRLEIYQQLLNEKNNG
ncbi:MAG: glycosyltransferase family 4 protein [Chitinophagales bacterium]